VKSLPLHGGTREGAYYQKMTFRQVNLQCIRKGLKYREKGTGDLTKALIYKNCAIISIYFKESQEGGNLWSTQKVSNVKLMLQVIYEAINS